MAIYPFIEDQDAKFKNLATEPIIINDLRSDTNEEIEQLNRLMYVRYEGDSLNIIPSCLCGNVYSFEKIGIRCSDCYTVCDHVAEKELESSLWIRAPKGVNSLMNPIPYLALKDKLMLDNKKFSTLDWMLNPGYRSKVHNEAIDMLTSFGVKRDINFIKDNLVEILEFMALNRINKSKDKYVIRGTKSQRLQLAQWVKKFHKELFPVHLPIPSRFCFVTEINEGITYTDLDMISAIDAARSMVKQDYATEEEELRANKVIAAKSINLLGNYYSNFMETTLFKRNGLLRQHVFGTRSHFSGRAVVTSIHGFHDHMELHLPWSLSITLFKYHLANKLLKAPFNLSPNEINRYLIEHTRKYCSTLDNLLQQLIDESGHKTDYLGLKGIPCILHRNPTLDMLSAELKMVTKFKTDVNDNSIGTSTLALRYSNTDQNGPLH